METTLPLAGVRVVDLTTGLAGPVASRLLGDAGADVVKVEPLTGDPTRVSAPIGFATWNRGKRSVALDLESVSGRASLDLLLERADLLVHDLPAARARALGLDASATARFPGLVHAGVPAYPEGHPLADVDATDALIQARTGLMDEQQGHQPGPVWIRLPFPSWGAAYLLAAGAVARLVQRQRTGVVLPVSTSVLQGGLAPSALYWQRWERLPTTLQRHTLPKLWPDAALSIFGCADGRFVQLAGAVGGWIESPPVLEALALRDQVDLSLVGVTPDNWSTWNAVFESHDSTWWRDTLAEHDVPCMVVHQLGECFTHDQARVNGNVVEVDDPVAGRLLQAGPPLRMSAGAAAVRPAPRLGQHDVADVAASWPERLTREPVRPDGDTRPLAGLSALDFGSMVAGPFGAQCLADLGAAVIKVETVAGDRGRGLTQFAGSQRGKRAIALDLKHPDARPVLDALLSRADVVLHNMRLAPAARLGLDGPGIRAVNPRSVFSHVSAYGQHGPMADHPGYDPTAQALTGWEHANAGDGQVPVWLRNSVFDVHAGLAACLGAVLGLYQRETTGLPGEASTSLLAVGITAASEVAVDVGSGEPTATGVLTSDQTGTGPSHRIHQVRDGWIAVDTADEQQAVVLAEWLDGRDATDHLDRRTVSEALEELAALGVPAAPVTLDQLDQFMDDEHHRTLGLARTLQTRDFGRIDLVGGFWSLGPQVVAPGESVPSFGEHTREVLGELGHDDAAVDDLLERGVARAGTARTGTP